MRCCVLARMHAFVGVIFMQRPIRNDVQQSSTISRIMFLLLSRWSIGFTEVFAGARARSLLGKVYLSRYGRQVSDYAARGISNHRDPSLATW